MFYLEKQVRKLADSSQPVSAVDLELGTVPDHQTSKYFMQLRVVGPTGSSKTTRAGENLFVLARDLFESFHEGTAARSPDHL